MWVSPISNETNHALAVPKLTFGKPFHTRYSSGDFQYILILDQYNNLIASLDVNLSNSKTCTKKSFDLTGAHG